MNSPYSVLMCVYYKENPSFLSLAIESILNQTYRTNDFVIVCDGQLTVELDEVLDKFSQTNKCIHIYRLNENKGLGSALAFGINKCINEIVMRMDSDDYSLPSRAQKQIEIMDNGADITCGSIAEFSNDYKKTSAIRKLPLNRKEMRRFIKKRCPFNHPCVTYKKSLILSVGNYRDLPFREDYDLWIRVFLSNCKIRNTNDILVHMRVGDSTIERRFSKEAMKSKKIIRKELLDYKLINKFEYLLYTFGERLISLLPKPFKKIIYRIFLRK